MKKFYFLFILALLPFVTNAAVEIDGIYYNLTTGETNTAEVTYGNNYSGEVVIPASFTYNEVTYSVTSIGDRAFSVCINLTSVTIPNSVTSIGDYSFKNCIGLTSVTIPNSITSVGQDAFVGCSGLTSVHVMSIEAWCNISFRNVNSNPLSSAHHLYLNGEEILDLVIPNSVTSIGDNTFHNCTNLTSVTIPNSVTFIGSSAFSGCTSLTSVTIPNSVTSIGAHTFSGCTSMASVTIPNSITSIGFYTFYQCSSLSSLTIPNSVTSIDSYAFAGCSSVTSVTIPNSVTSIGSSAFYECSGLTSVTISNSLTTIGNSVFEKCSGLTSVTIPNSVTTIGNHAFATCSSLNSITIPNSVTSVDDYAFAYCISLLSATIPYSVTTIGNHAYDNCSGLTSVSIPNSVISIGNSAFYKCSGLTSLTIPNSVTSIGDHAFYDCNGLTSVTISSSITSIGESVFQDCSGLTSLTIPNSVTSIGERAFTGCSGLTSLTIPNSVTSIAEYAFSACRGLLAVDIPNNLKIIKKGTFYGCSSLESVIIPSSVEYIYQEAFANCSKLASVKSLAETPPFLYDNSFSNFEIPLFVPEASIDSYKAANGWKNFTNVLSLDAAKHKLTYKVDGEVYVTYELYEGELITPEPAPTREGYEFSGWSTIPPTMPAHDVTITGTFTLISDYDEIKITSAGQTTWCSKYDLDFTEEESLKVYTATGYKRSTGTIWLSRVKEVPAGEGILIMGDEGVYKIPHRSTTAYYANLMVGTVAAMTLNETDGEYTNYYLSKGTEGVGFYKVNGSVNLGANRAYLPLKKGTSGNANTRYIGLSFDDGATNIDPLSASDADESNAAYYNLQGQRVDNPTKGLYIKNGRKVVIK